MNAVAITSDTSTLLNALSKTFSSSFTVLGELLQNARRAGASRVNFIVDDEVIVVEDDGCGIENFATLFSIARSGWDDTIQATESPYGMGFAATWFACKTLEVSSRGLSLAAATSDLLALKRVDLVPATDTGKTRITLRSYTMGSAPEVIKKIHSLSRGFPIPVSVNGEEVERKDALNESFIKTSIGYATPNAILEPDGRTYYLQGLPIKIEPNEQRYYHHSSVTHLDATQFEGRMPDRDSLLNPEEAKKKIKLGLDAAARLMLEELASTMPAAAFVHTHSSAMIRLGMHDLHNRFDCVPARWVWVYNDHPIVTGESSYDRQCSSECSDGVVTREDLIRSGLYAPNTQTVFDEEDLRAAVAVYAIEGYIAAHPIPKWHWAYDMIVALTVDDFNIVTEEVVGETNISIWGYSVGLTVANKVFLEYRGDARLPERIEVPFIHNVERNNLYVNAVTGDTESAVRQVTNFECDEKFDEDGMERAADALRATILMITSKDSSVLLRRFIELGMPMVPDEFAGKSFQVLFDADKKMHVVVVEESRCAQPSEPCNDDPSAPVELAH